MAGAQTTRSTLEALVVEHDLLVSKMQSWQERVEVTEVQTRETRHEYMDWYARSRSLILPEDLEKFDDMYKGGTFIARIRAFLDAPLEINPLWNPSTENQLVSKWKHKFDGAIRQSLTTQRQLLMNAIHSTTDVTAILDELSLVFSRLPDFLQILGDASNENVPSPALKTEKDLQVLVHALLRVLYSDVRPEDYIPQFGGGKARTDFLIKDVGVLVETKMTRERLGDRKVGEELLVDWGRY